MMSETWKRLRIAAMADLHRNNSPEAGFKALFAQAEEQADVLLLCGDLTDYGLAEEAKRLLTEIGHPKIPILAVLGNHDYQAGQQGEITKLLEDGGIKVLDGQAHEVLGVGFAGAKGFAGGFGVHTLEPWGENTIKSFVQEGLDESMKLELALSRLRTNWRIAVLHYAPIAGTVEGEPPEIYAFLGSSRLEEPLNRYNVTAVFHGHAHRGALEGKTRDGIPVYNVAMPLLKRSFPDQPPFRVIELPLASPPDVTPPKGTDDELEASNT